MTAIMDISAKKRHKTTISGVLRRIFIYIVAHAVRVCYNGENR